MIDVKHKILSVRKQCSLLGLNRSTLYYQAKGSDEEVVLLNQIYDIWVSTPFYGYRRIWAELRHQGYEVNRKRVQRLMKVLNLQAIYPKPNVSQKRKEHKIYPYLLKGLTINRPNMVWCTDITYVRVGQGFVYLVALIDVYSRYIVSWRLSITLEACFCIEMLEEAFKKGVSDFMNTDQGSQFTSQEWINRVEAAGAKVSMDGQGRWADNIPVERFWRSVKYEDILLNSYETVEQVRQGIKRYIEFYNERRPHQSLGYARPGEVYRGQLKANAYIFKEPSLSRVDRVRDMAESKFGQGDEARLPPCVNSQ